MPQGPQQPRESKFSTLMQMANDLLPTAQPPPQFSSTPINLNPPSSPTTTPNNPNNNNANNSNNNNNNPPSPLSSSTSSPQPSSRKSLAPGTSYVNLNSGSPMAVRPPVLLLIHSFIILISNFFFFSSLSR